MRAPAGTYGAYLKPEAAKGPAEAFLLPREFAHLHSAPDASFHLTLPEPIRSEAIEKGWAEPTVVIRFWIIAVILAVAGLSTLKLR